MRIQENSNAGAQALGQTAPAQSAGSTSKGGSTQSPTETGDRLQLSTLAGSLSRIIQSDSVSRSQRVTQLADAVRSGTYQFNPQAVSSAIVDHIVSTSQNAQ